MNKSTRKTLIIILTYVLIFALFIYFILIPSYRGYLKNKQKNLETKQIIEANEIKINSLKKVESNEKQFSDLFTNVNKLWPDILDVSSFIVETEGLAKEMQIVIDSFSINEQKPVAAKPAPKGEEEATTTTKSKAPMGTKFTVVFRSDYNTLIDFLTRMETFSRLNSLNTISVSSAENGLNISISGNIYYGK